MELKNDRIKSLLEKFWEGNTSLDEERELKEYFRNTSVGENTPDEIYFRMLLENDQKKLDHSFDEEVIRKIHSIKKTIPMWNGWLSRAVMILAVGGSAIMIWVLSTDNPVQPPVNKIAAEQKVDPEVTKAYEQTRQALMLVSSKLNKGKEQTMLLGKFGEAQQQVKSGIEQ